MKFKIAPIVLWIMLTPVGGLAQEQQGPFQRLDVNHDDKLTKDEMPENRRVAFKEMDANGDESVSRDELLSYFKTSRAAANQPAANRPERARPVRGPSPTHANVAYGEHEKQAFDIWLAEPKDGKPTPLVIYIHGGGFRGGDKNASGQPVQSYLDHGISFASINYRLSNVGPYPIMMNDCARGLQYIRSKSKEWNIDAPRIACYGGSAGAGISLWLGFHEDLAQPESDDLIARQSTRIVAVGTQNGQSTYDMRTFRNWFGVANLPPHPALITFYAVESEEDWESDRVKRLMTDASAITHLTKDDVPVFMNYGRGDVPVDVKSDPGLWVHHAKLGLKLKEAMDAIGLECHVSLPDHPSKDYKDLHEFLREKVLSASDNSNDAAPGESDAAQIAVPVVSTATSPIDEILVSETSYAVIRKPPGAGPFPTVIFLHGGLGQSPIKKLRADMKNLPVQNRFLAWGYAVVNATRRKITHDPLDRGVVDDTVAMIQAVKAIPSVDPSSVVLYGGSGGGTLAIELAGVADLAAVVAGEPATIIYMGMFNKDHVIFDAEGKPTGDRRWDVMKAVPNELYTPEIRQWTRDKLVKIDCPVLVLHGDQHALKHFNLDLFIPEMKAMGKNVETIIYPGEDHGFYWGRGNDPMLSVKANRDADVFFRKHIATQPEAIDPALINHEPTVRPSKR